MPALGQAVFQPAAAIWAEAQAKAVPIGLIQAALGQIGPRLSPFRATQRLGKGGARSLERIGQAFGLVILCDGLWITCRQRDAHIPRQPLHRLRERHILCRHDKVERIAMLATAKAMIGALGI